MSPAVPAPPPTPTSPRSYRAADVALLIGCSEKHIRRLMRDGRIRIVRIGHLVRIPPHEVERIVKEGC